MRVEPFLKDAVGMHQDRGRDDVPPGHVWALLDYVPRIAGATLRNRGGWTYASQALPSTVESLVWAPYASGGKLVAVTNSQAYDVPVSSNVATLIGTVLQPFRANPYFYRDKLYLPSGLGFVRSLAFTGAWAIASLPGTSPSASQQISSFRDRLVVASGDDLWFAQPGDPTLAWDPTSFISTDAVITGLRAMRSKLLVFHSEFVEQITGTTPPDAALSDPTGDMSRGIMWSGAGCFDARSIAGWQENVVFADERGVHITDGGLVRNMIEQGGMSRLWRSAFEQGGGGEVGAVGGTVYGNYYVCTVRMAVGTTYTWVCDIPTRRWFRWTNINANAHATSGAAGMPERLFGTSGTRVINMEKCFKPDLTQVQTDENAVNILPVLETPWLRMSRDVGGFRRLLNVFVRFLADSSVAGQTGMVDVSYVETPEDTTYESLGTIGEATTSLRRKLLISRRLEGIAFKLTALLPIKDLRVHNIGVQAEAEETQRL
jgi:hypothetical protein